MNALILAAGYATRLYPLTQDFPKPLLEVGGRAILDHLVDQLESLAGLDSLWLVTNHRFFPHFEQWRARRPPRKPMHLLDDGTTRDDERLGAVGDLRFALGRVGLEDDLLVTAADNLPCFPLAEFVTTFQARRASLVCVHRVTDPERLRRTGVAVLDTEGRVVEFAEKPREPKSQWAVPPLYLFPRATLPRVSAYLDAGGSPEAPGHFLEWLCRVEPVYAWPATGPILDIGTPASLEVARRWMASSRS